MRTVKANFVNGDSIAFNVYIQNGKDFNPLCDSCRMSNKYIHDVFRTLENVCLFSDKPVHQKTVLPVVVLYELSPSAIIEWVVESFLETIIQAHIEEITATDLEGDLIDSWSIP